MIIVWFLSPEPVDWPQAPLYSASAIVLCASVRFAIPFHAKLSFVMAKKPPFTTPTETLDPASPSVQRNCVSGNLNNSPLHQRVTMANADTPQSSIRVLVVDDFERWRQEICSILETQPELRVIAETADGLEAVHKAKELQPDLILLDIGLPTLNGLEAASRIPQVAPGAKILFLTQNSDKEIVRAALSTGAQGYILKTDAGRELLPAVAGVLGGDNFVSSGINGSDYGETEDTYNPFRLNGHRQ